MDENEPFLVSILDTLFQEVNVNNIDYVKKFLEVHPEKVNEMLEGKRCIHIAASRGNHEIINLLMNTGRLNINTQDSIGNTVLHYAALGNKPETIKFLIDAFGANAKAATCVGRTALHVAVIEGFADCVKVLLSYDSFANCQDSNGNTVLHEAIKIDNMDIIREICTDGYEGYDTENHTGFTALDGAAIVGNIDAIRLILEQAPHLLSRKKRDGFTLLHLATVNNHREIVELLVEEGHVDKDAVNNKNQTALMLAIAQGNGSIVEYLLEAGCDINIADDDGDTAMHVAIVKTMATRIIYLDSDHNPHLKLVCRLLSVRNAGIPQSACVPIYISFFNVGINKLNYFNCTPFEMISDCVVYQSALIGLIYRLNSHPLRGVELAESLAKSCEGLSIVFPQLREIKLTSQCQTCKKRGIHNNVTFDSCKPPGCM